MIYGFPFKIKPWAHQLAEYEYSRDLSARALHWQMRIGKTKVIIDTATYLFLKNKIDAVLVVARSGVHANWIRREVPKHSPIPYCAEWWNAEKAASDSYRARLHLLLQCDSLIYFSVNNESFIRSKAQNFISQLLKLRVLLVVDEVHDFRTHNSERSKLARKIARRCRYIRILTGTNNGNCPLGNWSQFEILSPAALGFDKYGQFKKTFAILGQGRTKTGRVYETIDGYRHLDMLQERINRWTSTITRSDCSDLPPLVITNIDVWPTNTQKRAYRQMKKDFETQLEDGKIVSAPEIAVRQNKMQQVLLNFLFDEHGIPHTIDNKKNPKLDALIEQLNDIMGKAIVWCWYKPDFRNVRDRLKLSGISFVEYHGGISKSEQHEAEARFREDPKCKVFLGQPKSAGLGLDLSAAEAIIWYSLTWDIVTYDQANERATEKGSTAIAVLHLVVPQSVDENILENHSYKRQTNRFMQSGAKFEDVRNRALDALRKDNV